jgi:hypothetical protein
MKLRFYLLDYESENKEHSSEEGILHMHEQIKIMFKRMAEEINK